MEANLVAQIAASLGPAGATFLVMWLWLSSVRTELKDMRAELALARKDAIETLERVLPLMTSVSGVVDANKREADRVVRDRHDSVLARLETKLDRMGE